MSDIAAGLLFGVNQPRRANKRPHPLCRLAIGLIDLYRRYLSPRKGYACPHRLLHGGESCSASIRSLYQMHRPMDATRSAWGRLRACSLASQTLAKAEAGSPGTPGVPGHPRRHHGQCCIVLPLPTCGGSRTYRAP